MKLVLVKVSDDTFEKDVEINTVEELFELMDEYGGNDLILSKEIMTLVETNQGTVYEEVWGIRIYDDYIEQGLTNNPNHGIIKTVKEREERQMARVDLKDMSIRNEFADEVINSIEELQSKATTNGEMKILYLMFETFKNNIEFKEREG